MVCVKTVYSTHDFLNEGIDVIIDGDIVTANQTSLGADQGVGLAMMLAILEDKSLNHPDLEFLFTVQEETTFKGAVTFPYFKVASKKMINLDNSKDNSVYIGADGDICLEFTLNCHQITNSYNSYRIIINNLPGGNSGDNILLSTNNAITEMAKKLKGKNVFISSIDGGTCENDIATSCEIVINTNENVYDIFKEIKVEIIKMDNAMCFSIEDTQKIINQILDLKCGFITPSNASANLGIIKTIGNKLIIDYVFRSMEKTDLDQIFKQVENLGYGFSVEQKYSDPIWEVNKNSQLLDIYKNVYFNEFGEFPIEEICRGSIECASIKKRIENLDIISIGSNISKNHTTEETTYISSWVKIYRCLTRLLEQI